MNRRNKKGVTLVELIICCAIIVMVGGACTAVLLSGHRIFNSSSVSASTQMDADVIQTYLTNIVPRAKEIALANSIDPTDTESCYLYFKDNTFCIHTNGKDVNLPSVSEFKCQLKSAGNTSSSRAQFVYTIISTDGTSYSSGFVLANLVYNTVITGGTFSSDEITLSPTNDGEDAGATVMVKFS